MAFNHTKKDLPTFDKAAEKMAFVKWLNKIRVAPANRQCCYTCLDYFAEDEISVCDRCAKPFCKKCLPILFLKKKCKYPPLMYGWHYFCPARCCVMSSKKHECNIECITYKMEEYIEAE